MPQIKFSTNSVEDFGASSVKDTYLLAVSGGKESTFAFEWMQQASRGSIYLTQRWRNIRK
ncbi:MAG: hypothetical protein GDA48_16110 [Hormoscilla sp. GM102CHS1]|nr:hypothetical protein [Hormoscilla sp. GM102CHS1]